MGTLLSSCLGLLFCHAGNTEEGEGKPHARKGPECKTANTHTEIQTKDSDLSRLGPQRRVKMQGTALVKFAVASGDPQPAPTIICSQGPSLPPRNRICCTQKQESKAIIGIFQG